MNLRLPICAHFASAIAIVTATSALAGDVSKAVATRALTERAFANAVAVGEAEVSCGESIGKQEALALVRYCRWVSSATHPPCNTRNHCALIVGHIRRMCSARDADTLAQTCERFGASDWDAIRRFPAN